MEKTEIKLSPRGIEVRLGQRNYYTYRAICQDAAIRKWDPTNQVWVFPRESALDVARAFSSSADLEIDPEFKQFAHSFSLHLDEKFSGRLTDEQLSYIKTPLLTHQEQWLAFALKFKAVANLAEQGTGKSKMALDWASLKKFKMVLIVARNSNLNKWHDEVIKHSDFTPIVLKGSRRDRKERLDRAYELYDPVICVINYEYVFPWIDELLSVTWDAIILDESTAIKHPNSKRHKACCVLGSRAQARLILTGTPLVNSPIDAFGQFKFLNPNIFGGNFQAFKNRYCVFGGFGGYQIISYKRIDEIQEKIEQFSFRVLKKDCLDLPPKTYDKWDIEPAESWMKMYKELVNSELLLLEGQQLDNTMAIAKLNRCMQLCDGFLYHHEASAFKNIPSPKMTELVEFLEDYFMSKEKIVIWAHFRASIEMLEKNISTMFPDVEVRSIMGGAPVNDRSASINWFNESYSTNIQKRCLILQTAANMHGIDLSIDTCVYYSRSWNNEEWLQSQDRIHGIGRGIEGSPCTYVVLGISGTVEDSIHKALQRKQLWSDLILKDVENLRAFMLGEV